MIATNSIEALKNIIKDPDVENSLTKQILLFLLDKSEDLTKEVCLTLTEHKQFFTGEEIRTAAHKIGGKYSNKLYNFLRDTAGSEFTFSLHYGNFEPPTKGNIGTVNTDGQFEGLNTENVGGSNEDEKKRLVKKGMPMRYTFWLAKKSYSKTAELVRIEKKEKLTEIEV